MTFLKGPDGIESSKRLLAVLLTLAAVIISIWGAYKVPQLAPSIISIDLTGAFGLLGITVADRFIERKSNK